MLFLGKKLKADEYNADIAAELNANGWYCKDINDGEYVYEVVLVPQQTEAEKISTIRKRRVYECFSIINRGELWYATLSEEQKKELSTWYNAWLDAPQTCNVPQRPKWLK